MAHKWVYAFEEGNADMKNLLGGKGANLAEMTRIGIPVPPGFIVTTEACIAYQKEGQFPEGMWDQVLEYLNALGKKLDRKFADDSNPLLVSVRSGARVSMPGMMDTILNCGLRPGLADHVADKGRFWSVYAAFIQQFANTVAHIPVPAFDEVARKLGQNGRFERALAEAYIALYERHNVFRRSELVARREIILSNYAKILNIEARTMLYMARREIIPACAAFRLFFQCTGKARQVISD